MKKKALCAALAAVMAVSLAACGGGSSSSSSSGTQAAAAGDSSGDSGSAGGGDAAAAANDPKVTLRYAEVNNPDDTIVGQIAKKFKEEVESISGGSITIDLQASGVLGAEGDYLDDMVGGGGMIDMARLSVSTITGYGAVPKQTMLCLPYVFMSREHFWNFANSELADEILNENSEEGLGIKGLMFGEEGFRDIFCSKEISSLDDLKGLKIRVSTDPTMTKIINAMGPSATVVSYSELYSSLQSGVVDGAENPLGNYLSQSFYEVAPYVYRSGHQLGVCEIVITDTAWNKLTENQQQAVLDAIAICKSYNQEISQENEDASIKTLTEEKGVTFVDADKDACKAACQSVIDEGIKGYEDLYNQIEEMQ